MLEDLSQDSHIQDKGGPVESITGAPPDDHFRDFQSPIPRLNMFSEDYEPFNSSPQLFAKVGNPDSDEEKIIGEQPRAETKIPQAHCKKAQISSNGSDGSDGSDGEEEEKGGPGIGEESKGKKSKGRIKKGLKNYLPSCKRCLRLPLLRNRNPSLVTLFDANKSTSRLDFETLFRADPLKLYFGEAFRSNFLKRELQHSRIDPQNRILFLDKTRLLKNAFIEGKLPNLIGTDSRLQTHLQP